MTLNNRMSVAVFLGAAVSAGGCLDAPEDSIDWDVPLVAMPADPDPICPEGSPECDSDPYACFSNCWDSSLCEKPCHINGYPITCGEYGVCQPSCSDVCSIATACNYSCYEGGVGTTCGDFGTCSPPPDCLVEFWTNANFSGERGCYGTAADVMRVLTQGGRLDVNQLIHNDQYSSFRTIEQMCIDRGISPCHLIDNEHKIRTNDTRVYIDAWLSGKSKGFPADSDANFSNDRWHDSSLQGIINDKVSSFYMNFDVSPICYKAYDDGPSCTLCLDGAAWLQRVECTPADPLKGQGWFKVNDAGTVWVFFDGKSYSPAKVQNLGGGKFRLVFEKYTLLYPVPLDFPYAGDIGWQYKSAAPTLVSETAVPKAF